MMESSGKIRAFSLGLSVGTVTGLYMFVMGLLGMTGYGVPFITLISTMYLGYAPTFWGSVLGLLWGFVDGFTFGILVGYVYNCYCNWLCKGCKGCKPDKTGKPE